MSDRITISVGSIPLPNRSRAQFAELGYVEGKSIVIESRGADSRPDRLPVRPPAYRTGRTIIPLWPRPRLIRETG